MSIAISRFGVRSSSSSETTRLEGFDAARGAAMVLVCLSHFIEVYFRGGQTKLASGMGTLTLIASPTFIMLSGVMVGMLTSGRDERSRVLRIKLADRALFLILIGHPLLTLALYRPGSVLAESRWFGPTFITDAIAVSILVSLWAIQHFSPLRRAIIGAVLFITSWSLVLAWHPHISFDVVVEEALVGSLAPRYLPYCWPLAPWAGVYLMWTAFGESLARRYRANDLWGVERILLLTNMTLAALAIAWYVFGMIPHEAILNPLFGRRMKWPPGPMYLMFFGSIGVGLLWLAFLSAQRKWAGWLMREAACVGRCSLAVFIVQAFLYYRGLPLLHLGYTPLWPVMFAVSLVPLYLLARLWDRQKWNVHLSVGLQALVRRIERSRRDAQGGDTLLTGVR